MKTKISFTVACLIDSVVSLRLNEFETNQDKLFMQVNQLSGKKDVWANKAKLQKNPDLVFGKDESMWMYNTREGIADRDQIDMHDDEPAENPEHLMDDSSQSGSDGEETEEEKKIMRENLKKAENAKLQIKH